MTSDPNERLSAAEAFLQEAVYRSRAKQAAVGGLAGLAPDARLGAGQCGLGEKAVVELDLSPKGIELAQRLWSAPLPETEVERVRELMRAFVRAQDALDRDRNHFLKAFRKAHGFDRRQYTQDEQREYDAGLEAVNARADAARREHAERLLDA